MRAEPGTVVVEEGDKDKKKNINKRRSNRRSKQNSPLPGAISATDGGGECLQLFGNGCGRTNGRGDSVILSLLERPVVGELPLNGQAVVLASDVAFSSMRTMHDEQSELLPQQAGGAPSSKSCFEPVVDRRDPSGIFRSSGFRPSCQFEDGSQVRLFADHWSISSANDAVEKGNAFKALFRVNAHNRLEAYCKIQRVHVDILINGSAAQNRAVEGDTVVIQVDPLPCWTRMKGSDGHSNNISSSEDCSLALQVKELSPVNLKGKDKVAVEDDLTKINGDLEHSTVNGCSSSALYSSHIGSSENNGLMDSVMRLCALINSSPCKRPTGRVLTIIGKSPRRDAIVGFLNVKQWFNHNAQKNGASFHLDHGYISLTSTDPRFPKMLVLVKDLPDDIKIRLQNRDSTVEMELVAAVVDNWDVECPFPRARISYVIGKGSDMDAQMKAILYENAICLSDFSAETISCLPQSGWEVPLEELKSRRDLRNLCIFTIDPPTATDLDDALSFEMLPNSTFRIGVHITDASFFVSPGSAIDIEAQTRSTTVYLLRERIPMLPSLLSENLGSLNPGVDKLAFSIVWEMNTYGEVLDRWIGRSVIRSCCKLSYELAQDIIDGESINGFTLVKELPQLYGQFQWSDVFGCVRSLHKIAKILRERRFHDGALRLDAPKVSFLLDDCGIPYDCVLSDRNVSFLVEEFMLLANCTAAEVISRAFPDYALLRRHPEPDVRKLRELKSFCSRHNLELNTSSSGQFHKALEHIREKLKDDRVLLDILISYATRPMQLAMYFCSGDLKDNREDWGHYALSVPVYTHFTSPLRRYPDIVVHRMLAAAVDAEESYLKLARMSHKFTEEERLTNCFTGLHFSEDVAKSSEGREVLSAAAIKHSIPQREKLSDVAAHCNERKLASRHVKDACNKLYMWMVLLRKEVMLSEARVLGLGPRFMSVYVHQLAIERRIYYDDVEGMMVEWLENTSTLVLSFSKNKHSFRKASPGNQRIVGEVALVINPCNMEGEPITSEDGSFKCGAERSENMRIGDQLMDTILKSEIQPAVLPLTIPLLSTIPVALHAVGGDDGPIDIGARLFISSYLG